MKIKEKTHNSEIKLKIKNSNSKLANITLFNRCVCECNLISHII